MLQDQPVGRSGNPPLCLLRSTRFDPNVGPALVILLTLLSFFTFQDAWWLSCSMVVANKIEDNDIIDFLSSAVASGQRRLFNVVSKSDLLKLVSF